MERSEQLEEIEDKQSYKFLLLVAAIQFSLFFSAWLIVFIRGNVLGEAFPFNTFLPSPPPFGDFLIVLRDWSQGNLSSIGYGRNYFPGLYLPMNLFVPLADHMIRSILLGIIVPLGFIALLLVASLRKSGALPTFVALLLIISSYPVLIMLETGNLELWILLLLTAAMLFYQKRNWVLFAVMIGIATSFKGFPLLFLLVPFVLIREWKQFVRVVAVAIGTAFLVTALALIVLPGGFLEMGWQGVENSISATFASLDLYKQKMWFDISGMHFGHSFLNAVHAFGIVTPLASESWALPIQFVGIILTFLVAFAMRGSKDSPWKVWMLVAISSCLFAPTSTDYKLVYFVPAFVLLVNEISSNKFLDNKINLALLVSFAIIFSPKPWLQMSEDPFSTAQVWFTAFTLLADFGIIFCQAIITANKNHGLKSFLLFRR